MATHTITPTPNPAPPTLSFDANNRIVGGSYDATGNLGTDPATGCTFTFDAEDRLTSVATCATAGYQYNAQGRREHTVVNGVAHDAIYGLAGEARAVFAGQSQLVQGEIYFDGQHIATYANGTTYFDHADRLGTERARTNLSGGTVEADTSLPYGGWLNQAGTISSLHFVGQPFDGESALNYLGARYESGYLGRFLTPDDGSAQDPADPQSWDLYTYARDNPVTLADPSGRYWCKAGEPPRSPNCVSDKEFAKKTKAQQVGWVHVSNDITVTVRASAAPPVRAIEAPDPFYQIAAAVTAYNPGGFIRDFEVLSITTALTGPLAGVLGEGAEAGTAAEADAAAGTAAEVADVASVVARATAATGNETITVASREVAEEAADQFLGRGARTISDNFAGTGRVAGRISADGRRVVLEPHADLAGGSHINFINKATGGNLHVRF